MRILWINLVAAVTLSLALSGEPGEPGIMDRPPRPPGEPVLSRPVVALVLFASVLIGGSALLVYLLERDLGAAPRRRLRSQCWRSGSWRSCSTAGSSTPRASALHALRGNRLVLIAAAFSHTWIP